MGTGGATPLVAQRHPLHPNLSSLLGLTQYLHPVSPSLAYAQVGDPGGTAHELGGITLSLFKVESLEVAQEIEEEGLVSGWTPISAKGQDLGRFALVSFMSCPTSTSSRFNSYSTSVLTSFSCEKAHLEASFPLRCFQRLSLPYLATLLMPLEEQQENQRYVHSGPLVLGAAPLNLLALVTDRDRTVSRRSEPSSRATLMGEQPNPWDLLQPQDVTSRHRGAKRFRRYGRSGIISLLSPG